MLLLALCMDETGEAPRATVAAERGMGMGPLLVMLLMLLVREVVEAVEDDDRDRLRRLVKEKRVVRAWKRDILKNGGLTCFM
jgi:hypothetical protein